MFDQRQSGLGGGNANAAKLLLRWSLSSSSTCSLVPGCTYNHWKISKNMIWDCRLRRNLDLMIGIIVLQT
jgi:hypothetical protein